MLLRLFGELQRSAHDCRAVTVTYVMIVVQIHQANLVDRKSSTTTKIEQRSSGVIPRTMAAVLWPSMSWRRRWRVVRGKRFVVVFGVDQLSMITAARWYVVFQTFTNSSYSSPWRKLCFYLRSLIFLSFIRITQERMDDFLEMFETLNRVTWSISYVSVCG